MGFAAGFGQAFSESYNLGTQLRKREEADVFDKIWSTYERNREKREEAEKNDSRIAGAAKQIAGRYGQPVAPIMDALKSGLSVEYVDDMAKSGNWRESNGDGLNPQTPEAPEITQTQQVQEEGEGTGLAQREAPTSSAPPGITQNAAYRSSLTKAASSAGVSEEEFTQGLTYTAPTQVASSGGYEYLPRPKPMELDKRKEQLIAMRASATPEELQAIDAELGAIGEGLQLASGRQERPTTPAEIAAELAAANASGDIARIAVAQEAYSLVEQQMALEANLRNGGGNTAFVKDTEGNIIPATKSLTPQGPQYTVNGQPVQAVQEVSPQEIESRGALLGITAEKPVMEYRTNQANVANFVKISGDLASIAQQDPTVLTTVANVNETVNRLGAEVGAAMQMIDNAARSNNFASVDPATITGFEIAIDERLNSLVSQGVQDSGELKALFDAKRSLLVYQLGIMNEQSGRAFTDVDRRIHEQILSASNRIDPWLTNLAQINRDVLGKTDNQALAINQDPRVMEHARLFGSTPFQNDQIVKPASEFILEMDNGNPRLLEFIDQYADRPIVGNNQSEVNPQTNIDPAAVDMLRNGQGTPEQFDEIFGPGAAARVLGR